MQLSNINTTDITDAIRLGCRMMSNVFNADDNDMPFFGSEGQPKPTNCGLAASTPESHVPGPAPQRIAQRRRRGQHICGFRCD